MLVLEKRPHKCTHADVPMSSPHHRHRLWNCHAGECARPMAKAYWPFQPAVSIIHSYGKMVPLRHPMVKPYPLEPGVAAPCRSHTGHTTTSIMDCHSGKCAWPMAKPYKPFQPAVSIPQSYGKMVPPRHPMVKTCPPRASTSHPSAHTPRDPHLLCNWFSFSQVFARFLKNIVFKNILPRQYGVGGRAERDCHEGIDRPRGTRRSVARV